MSSPVDRLKADLADAEADLRAHVASWEYAFAMGSTQHGGAAHPAHVRTRERTAQLVDRCRGLRARIAEYEI
jgi:hypothetical protein